LKINILYNFTNQPFGGGNQFLTALKNQLIALRLYENNPLKADAIIFNSLPFGFMLKALNMLYMAKRRAIKLIHRVDGPISGYRGKDEYVDKAIYQLNNKFADATVFQSEWSRQQKEPDNYIISTGETHSVADFVEAAFTHVGINDWRKHIKIDPQFKRPSELFVLKGCSDKAKEKLGWEPTVKFNELVSMMVDADLERLKK